MRRFNRKMGLFLGAFLSIGGVFAHTAPPQPEPKKDTALVQKMPFTKNIVKTYTLAPEAKVVLAHKFGKIDVKTGPNRQVIIRVNMVVQAASKEAADQQFSRLNVAFTESAGQIKAETQIESNDNLWPMNRPGNMDFTIDYEVVLPQNTPLDVSNRHGSTTIAALSSAVNIDQKYGDVRLESGQKVYVNANYGNAFVGKATQLSAHIAYGKLVLKSAQEVALDTKYARIYIEKADKISIQSAYDDYQIREAGTVAATTRYGDISLDTADDVAFIGQYTSFGVKFIQKRADFQVSDGRLRIGGLPAGFDYLSIQGKDNDVDIVLDPSVSCQVDYAGTASHFKTLRTSSVKYALDNASGQYREVTGYLGSNPNTKSLVRIRLSRGQCKIR